MVVVERIVHYTDGMSAAQEVFHCKDLETALKVIKEDQMIFKGNHGFIISELHTEIDINIATSYMKYSSFLLEDATHVVIHEIDGIYNYISEEYGVYNIREVELREPRNEC